MDATKLVAIILGATGFWKLIEVLLKLRLDKKRTKAETHHLFEQANTQILSNWVAWSQKLEQEVRTLEKENQELEEKLTIQQNSIILLEKQVSELKQTNAMILNELKSLKKTSKKNKENIETHGIQSE